MYKRDCCDQLQERLRDKVHLQTVHILEREDALTPRMEEAGEEAPRHTPRPPTRGLFCLSDVPTWAHGSGFVLACGSKARWQTCLSHIALDPWAPWAGLS